MTKTHTDRGKVTERMLAIYLREHGFPNAERAVRTGVRTPGREVVDPGDITGTPGLVWQSKSLRPITAAENSVLGWMRETDEQRLGASADLGILVVRRDRRPAEEWFAYLPLADLFGTRGVMLPMPLADLADRGAELAVPVRLYLGDLVTFLRAIGYGNPIVEPEPPVALTALP